MNVPEYGLSSAAVYRSISAAFRGISSTQLSIMINMQYKRKLRTMARVAQIWTVYRNFLINTRESPVRYATAHQQLFHGEATDKIRGWQFTTVDNKRPSAHPEGEFLLLPFKSNPSRNWIPHKKLKITKSMAETIQ